MQIVPGAVEWNLRSTVGATIVVDRRLWSVIVPAVLAHALHATLMTELPRLLHLEAGGHDCQVTLIRLRANARPPAYRVFATGDRRLRRGLHVGSRSSNEGQE